MFLGHKFSSKIYKVLLYILVTNKVKQPYGILFLDAEKAFDRLEWGFIYRVLDFIGLGRKSITWIKFIYFNSKVYISENWTKSDSFSFCRDCSLFPLLFTLPISRGNQM